PRLVDVNTARAATLANLPGMTTRLASRIVKERKKQKFVHAEDLLERGVLDEKRFAAIRRFISALVQPTPYLQQIRTDPARVISGRSFRLEIDFINSHAQLRLVTVRVESLDRSIRRTREITKQELDQGVIRESLP